MPYTGQTHNSTIMDGSPVSDKHPIKVLALFGSPRRGGNTDILLDEFLRGCKSRGADIERIYLSRLQLKGCRGCMGCAPTGLCVVEDEMQPLYKTLDLSDRIVVASPIYFYGVPSQTKAVIDRAQALIEKNPCPTEKIVDGRTK